MCRLKKIVIKLHWLPRNQLLTKWCLQQPAMLLQMFVAHIVRQLHLILLLLFMIYNKKLSLNYNNSPNYIINNCDNWIRRRIIKQISKLLLLCHLSKAKLLLIVFFSQHLLLLFLKNHIVAKKQIISI